MTASDVTSARREIAVGLVGLGRFGKLHAAVLNQLPNVRLAAICDPLDSEVAAVGEQYGVADRFTDYRRLLDETSLDCLFIVTPEPLHAEMAIAAIAHRLPVFVEKPLATTAVEAQRVADAAATAGVPLQVGLVLRFEIQHAMLKREIVAGRFGEIVSLRVKRNVSRAWFGTYGDRVHPVYETSIHDLDLLLWYTASRCTKVYAVQRSRSGLRYPDACFALLQFANGSVAMLETSWHVPEGAPANVLTETWHGTIDAEIEIVGTAASARLRLLDSGLTIWSPRLVEHPEAGLWPELHGQAVGALREEDAHFIERVRAGSSSAVASVADAVEGMRIAEAIVASAEQGQEVILVDVPERSSRSG